MNLVVFDIGGTAVKYAFWQDGLLKNQDSFKTPDTFKAMKQRMSVIVEQYRDQSLDGIGISSPGIVNNNKRTIDGISAVPYLHGFPIFKELEALFQLPVAIENDANCAGIAEITMGTGQKVSNAVFLVLGTGVGGAVFINGKLYKGAHLFAGEFGLFHSSDELILSQVGSIVKVADKYEKLNGKKVTGKQIMELVDNGDVIAKELLDEMYDAIAEVIYSIQVSIDPEAIIIGGGISKRKEISGELSKRVLALLKKQRIPEILPVIMTCQFSNDANLIGAAMNFKLNHSNK